MIKYYFFIALILVHSLSLSAEVRIGFAHSRPPYVDSYGGGLEVDIAKSALEISGHTLFPMYFKSKNLKKALKLNRVDAIADININYKNSHHHLSDPYVYFINKVFANHKSTCRITHIQSLTQCVVYSWDGASKELELGLKKTKKTQGSYNETSNQSSQVKMLLQTRIDAVIMDYQIFEAHKNSMTSKMNSSPPEIDEYDLLKNPNWVGIQFQDEQLKNDFNKGLAELKKSGIYAKILTQYLGKESVNTYFLKNKSEAQ